MALDDVLQDILSDTYLWLDLGSYRTVLEPRWSSLGTMTPGPRIIPRRTTEVDRKSLFTRTYLTHIASSALRRLRTISMYTFT
jgi:hypothetical protein